MRGFNLSAWALSHRSFVIYLMLIAVAGGLYAFNRLGRSEDPTFIIKTMVVHAVWPGASIDDTMRQVTERIERKLQEIPRLDFLRSLTRAGSTTIFVNLDGATTAKQVSDLWYQVRKSVGDIRHTLPQGVLGPFFNDEFGDTFGIIYGFIADGFSQRELRDAVENIRSNLLRVPDVSKIEVMGSQDEKIFIEFSARELASQKIDRAAIIRALQAQNLVRPTGSLETQTEGIALRVSGAFKSEADFRDINLAVASRMIRLGDIATIRRGFSDPPEPMFRVNGRPAIGLAVAMQDGGDILALGRAIKAAMKRLTAELPVGIDAKIVADQAVTVEHAIADFMSSLWQAVVIILVVSFIALGIRPGLIIAICIPLTLAVVFAIMYGAAIDMQRISLGALIIALALLVDDAMTTIDAMLTRLAAGDDKVAAASFAYSAYAGAMLAGSLVTIAGFIPVGFAASSAGEYTFSLFAVVATSLLVSWLVATLFAPLLGLALLRAPKRAAGEQPSQSFVIRAYRGLLAVALRLRWLTLALTAGISAAAVAALPLIPNQFFPASDRPELLVDLRLPQNASIYASEKAANTFDAMLTGNPDVERWSTYVGRGAIRFYLPLDVQLPNPFFSQAVVVAKDIEARDRLRAALAERLATEIPDAIVRITPLELGPPVGWPVQYRVSGPDIATVRGIAFQIAGAIATDPRIRSVNFDWAEPAREVRIAVLQDEARRLGLSTEAVGAVLATVTTGTTISQVRDDIYLIDVKVRATDEERLSLDKLRNLQVPVAGGRTVPLAQFASFDYELDQPVIWRRDRIPTLTVQADVPAGTLPAPVIGDLGPAIDLLRQKLPEGYSLVLGGTVEESARSQASVFAVVPAMLLIMITILMVQLQSFLRLFVVLCVAPLGLIGVSAALLLSGRPLGFVAILGILALIGMITKNAVILIGQIEDERARGLTVQQAAIEACSLRFRPIMLTAVSTVLGLIPIAPTVFWGPMAFAMMGGLLAGTVLTLVSLPTLYVTLFERKRSSTQTIAAGGTIEPAKA